ncbi:MULTISPECIES: hypothetical protein [unclassified Streptomyces]|uniref:hypothetical protein n=1 Tax=unclassified Streptomyces TaxID=2593676 RepID=UPI002E816315|nr:hypothetical protein [Streptomyces sp. NBC_00589]WTI37558.1 hypothetical protein OIC96_22355 [Streptomyces sp. NBC_00775]WUB28764.1 hypothetical protein OHA51_27380 [Streptomyces sp. NBC_00589]
MSAGTGGNPPVDGLRQQDPSPTAPDFIRQRAESAENRQSIAAYVAAQAVAGVRQSIVMNGMRRKETSLRKKALTIAAETSGIRYVKSDAWNPICEI